MWFDRSLEDGPACYNHTRALYKGLVLSASFEAGFTRPGATHLPAALLSFLGRDLPLAPRLITAVGQG